MRLSGTEKQRDDALEALVLQQEIAEELERERKRNKKELSALQHTNATIIRQRDESQRVVVHLRSLIDGQAHHIEHIVRSLNKAPELSSHIGEGFEDTTEDLEHRERDAHSQLPPIREVHRYKSRASMKSDNHHATSGVETPVLEKVSKSKPSSRLSITDTADRHLRDKTDAIADIIRNISEQCAAAVEGLHLAHEAEEQDVDEELHSHIDPTLKSSSGRRAHGTASPRKTSLDPSDVDTADTRMETDSGHGGSAGHLTPNGDREDAANRSVSRSSSIMPPTPDLVGGSSSAASNNGRSSTSMSGYSNTTGTGTVITERNSSRDSQTLAPMGGDRTKIVGVDSGVDSASDNGSDNGAPALDPSAIDDVVGGKKSAVEVVGGSAARSNIRA